MSKNPKRTNTTFKTPLLNDCTNHLAFQLEQGNIGSRAQQKSVRSSYEAPLSDIVTSEFIRGYN